VAEDLAAASAVEGRWRGGGQGHENGGVLVGRGQRPAAGAAGDEDGGRRGGEEGEEEFVGRSLQMMEMISITYGDV
jgi:hypothetical protein